MVVGDDIERLHRLSSSSSALVTARYTDICQVFDLT
jgi:hypothetical protein